MSDGRSKVTLTDGRPVYPEHRELKENGQQRDYVVLSAEERAKGFMRPVRRTYVHVLPPLPLGLIELTDEQKEWTAGRYAKYEPYGPDHPKRKAGSSATGRFWTQEDIDRHTRGCGAATKMSDAIAETYARDPKFYSGTFCVACGEHYPVGEHGEFVWEDGSKVGT